MELGHTSEAGGVSPDGITLRRKNLVHAVEGLLVVTVARPSDSEDKCFVVALREETDWNNASVDAKVGPQCEGCDLDGVVVRESDLPCPQKNSNPPSGDGPSL